MPSNLNPSIVVAGGGTGAPNLLRALRARLPGSRRSIIVPVTDSGRSTGVARRLFDMPAPGDLRQCLTTLAEPDSAWARILEIRLRLERDLNLDGMAVGNLVLGALTQESGDVGNAAATLSEALGVKEAVLPVTVENAVLVADLVDGDRISGELEVRRPGKKPISRVEVVSDGSADDHTVPVVSAPAREALETAGWIILGPGSLWTSIGAVLAVNGVREAISKSAATVVFVCNTTTQPGQTDGLGLIDHVEAVTSMLGSPPDVVIANRGIPPEDTATRITAEGLHLIHPCAADAELVEARDIRLVTANLVGSDTLSSSLWQKLPTAYHDMDLLAEVIGSMVDKRDASEQ